MSSIGRFRVCEPGRAPLRKALDGALTLPSVLATMVYCLIVVRREEIYVRPRVTARFLVQRTNGSLTGRSQRSPSSRS